MTTYTILCGLSGRKLLKTPTGHMEIDCRTSVVDPLFGQRNSFLGKHDLPTKNLTETIKETEKHLVEYPTYLIGWSFGGLIASLQKRSKPIKKAPPYWAERQWFSLRLKGFSFNLFLH